MEVRELLRIAIKHIRLLTIFGILAGFAGAWFAYTQPPKYEGSVSFTINRINTQDTLDYQYDGYYGIKASELFGQTLVSWLETPSVLIEVYELADVDPQISTLSSFTGRFKARIYSPQTIVVTFQEDKRLEAEQLAQAISEKIVEKSDRSNQLADGDSLFDVEAEPSIIIEKTIPTGLAGLASAIAGFLIGIVLIAFKYYIQEHASRD